MRIYRAPSRVTPEVDFDLDRGIISFSGVSSPENSFGFYTPFIDALSQRENILNQLVVNLSFIHFNTSSSKCIYDLLRALKRLESQGVAIKYNWMYEMSDEDMLECGEDFSDFLGLDMNFVELAA